MLTRQNRITAVFALLISHTTSTLALTLTLFQSTQDAAAFGLSNDKSYYDFTNTSSNMAATLNPNRITYNQTFPQSLADEGGYQCSSADYGIPLIQACNNAFQHLPHGATYDTFGDRSNPDLYDCPLPWRVLDGVFEETHTGIAMTS